MTKVIMIQGTMSSAGKTFLTAGLCRIFKQDGYKVAPFKAQNMALNSFVTDEGLEMGRAQVVEAEAAGVSPEISMNPILLKPNSDTGSQLIVNGEARGDYTAEEYYKFKKDLMPSVLEAFNDLAERFDIVVIEGAGSPAEINLRDDDLVNMGLAGAVDAPVILVGDIDRGGVFAQLYGTVELMTEEERARVKAFVINKFRGDVDILTPGFDLLYDKVPIPVAGVIPYTDIDLDDEDSLSERLAVKNGKQSEPGDRGRGNSGAGMLKISVIRFPRISNFTDFNALERLPGIDLEYVSKPEELYGSDMIILPGTKSTMSDLEWLRGNGFEPVIIEAAETGIPVFGICGGFQMLGETLSDPYGVESRKNEGKMTPEKANDIGSVGRSQDSNSIPGLGLLPVNTVFAREKTRTRVRGLADGFNNVSIEGYEIHMGETSLSGGRSFSILKENAGDVNGPDNAEPSQKGESSKSSSKGIVKEDGCVYGNVYGTYVHGLFDSPGMQKEIVRRLSGNKVFYGIRFDPEKNGAESDKKAPGNEENGRDSREYAGERSKESSESAKTTRTADPAKYKEEQYDRLADVIRENLDMNLIYDILDGRL